MTNIRNFRTARNVTGRDHLILCKALAYAIATIGRLPDEWQEWSDKEDMCALLDALDGEHADFHMTNARAHIERRGIKVDADGRLTVSDRDPATVVALRPREDLK